mmetsp:Transcript_20617/g.30359  ORF Transcript_20617/g.30359 Transcript_20617/m.30359 type:complete len:253 (+) Transcript_20617:152-910(+)
MPSSSRVSLPGVTTETTVESPPPYFMNSFCRGIVYIIHSIISCICFWVSFFIVLFCCLPCICVCGLPNFGQEHNHDDAMLAAPSDMESRRQRNKDDVKGQLFSQKVEDATAAARLVHFMNNPDRNTNGNVLMDSWNSAVLSVRSLRSMPSCAICLKEYEAGDILSWSKQEQCTHAFHEECIVKWLSMHDDCPLCRCVIMRDDLEGSVPNNRRNEDLFPTNNEGSSRSIENIDVVNESTSLTESVEENLDDIS